METVSALAWVPDGSGFISGSQDRKINLWARHLLSCSCLSSELFAHLAVQGSDGKQRDSWGITAIRIADLAVTPDFTRLVAVGESVKDPILPTPRGYSVTTNRNGDNNGPRTPEHLMIVYDLTTKQPEL
jgi:WD40 repeat protein